MQPGVINTRDFAGCGTVLDSNRDGDYLVRVEVPGEGIRLYVQSGLDLPPRRVTLAQWEREWAD